VTVTIDTCGPLYPITLDAQYKDGFIKDPIPISSTAEVIDTTLQKAFTAASKACPITSYDLKTSDGSV